MGVWCRSKTFLSCGTPHYEKRPGRFVTPLSHFCDFSSFLFFFFLYGSCICYTLLTFFIFHSWLFSYFSCLCYPLLNYYVDLFILFAPSYICLYLLISSYPTFPFLSHFFVCLSHNFPSSLCPSLFLSSLTGGFIIRIFSTAPIVVELVANLFHVSKTGDWKRTSEVPYISSYLISTYIFFLSAFY